MSSVRVPIAPDSEMLNRGAVEMRQAMTMLNSGRSYQYVVGRVYDAMLAATLESPPVEGLVEQQEDILTSCTGGFPKTPGVVHRANSPCYWIAKIGDNGTGIRGRDPYGTVAALSAIPAREDVIEECAKVCDANAAIAHTLGNESEGEMRICFRDKQSAHQTDADCIRALLSAKG